MSYESFSGLLLAFAYYYPLFMSYIWICGGLYYRFHWEKKNGSFEYSPHLDNHPPVSIIVPAFNEEEHIEDTLLQLLKADYPSYEIIVVNDGSEDRTGEILNEFIKTHKAVRVVHLESNRGKATALNAGAMLAKHEILVCIDSDAMLEEHALAWLARHFEHSPRLAAVTGNPRIRNRSTLLGKIQVGEFSSIIGLIKRSQRIYGRVFTVSGVVTAFRKSALQKTGYWRSDTTTDDIDISWRLQLDHWDIRYEPNALCWILMPETYRGLWKQRVRWAVGGAQAAIFYAKKLFSWKSRRMWLVFAEFWLSVLWSYVLLLIVILWALGNFIVLPDYLTVPSLIPGWHGLVLGGTCLLQFMISLLIDSRYERGLIKHFFWIIWYPLAYWLINVLTTAVALPRAMFIGRVQTGMWVSPDRGFKDDEEK